MSAINAPLPTKIALPTGAQPASHFCRSWRNNPSTYEPAERPLQVALSQAEVFALVKYHEAQIRKIPKELGKVLLQQTHPAGITRAKIAAEYQKQGRALVEAHMSRARGLMSILRANG